MVLASDRKEYGRTEITVTRENLLFDGLPTEQTVWMSHGDQVSRLAPGFEQIAKSETCPFAAAENTEKKDLCAPVPPRSTPFRVWK